jgi:4-aminobutyrate aminotransferase-like enzyme
LAVTITTGQQIHQSPAIQAAIDTVVAEVETHCSAVTDVRAPDPALALSYEALCKRVGDARGRPVLYPYVGSGAGQGALVELADGSVKWDLITGIGVHFFGHSDLDLIRASLHASVGDTLKHGALQTNMEPVTFSEVLLEQAGRGSDLKYCYLSTSGAMANENALKVCFHKHAPAVRVVAFEHCFMGRSWAMSQIGDKAANRVGIPLNVHVDYMPFYDPHAAAAMGKKKYIDGAVAQLETYFDRYPGQHACFVFELVQGEGGFNVGDRDYFRALMGLCKDRGVAVWDDEIQSFGRTEAMFAYDHFGVGDLVDVFCVGKMTQACATLFTETYNPKPGLLSGTFTGEGVSFAVGQRIIERLRDGDWYGSEGRFAAHHAAFRAQVDDLASRHPDWFPVGDGIHDHAGGIGGMMRFSPFGGAKDAVIATAKACFDEGVILFWCGHGPFHIRMLPPLPSMSLTDWPRIFEVIERAMARVASTR